MVLQQMQSLLARLYDVPSEHAVMDFLLSDRAQLHAVLPEVEPDADERVLVTQDEAGLHVGVYIAADVISRLSANNPMHALDDANLRDYCTALEGVSHFQYLTWRAAREQQVSLLELELQAEVDKYAAALLLLTSQCCGEFPHALHERLFHRVGFDARLDGEQLARYREANRFAARFCRRLDERYLRRRRSRPEAWLRELRGFYRLSHAQKLRAVAA
jgi:hypothetical protein